jgi:uroporphyrin-III C-methyltransferase/precorrin-2 dehydrogenase/sirohydrochlorin ferrochelatase
MSGLASLPLFHKIAGQNVLVLGEGPAAEPKRRLVERAGGVVVDDFACAVDEGVRIAFIAFDDARACEAAAVNARCAGMLVNVVDRPELCDFTTPSILERDPLLIAIGTGGASAGLAKHVRLRLERVLPETLGALARALEAARPVLRRRLPEGADRRRAVDSALREGGPLDPFDPEAYQRVARWAQGAEYAGTGRKVELVLTNADPEELTLRQARLLGEADLLLIDGAVPAAILGRARADAARRVLDTKLPDNGGASRGLEGVMAGSGLGHDRSEAGPGAGSAAEQGGAAPGLTVILRWRPVAAGD